MRCAQWRTGPPPASDVAMCSFPFAISVMTQLALFRCDVRKRERWLDNQRGDHPRRCRVAGESRCAWRLEMPVSDMSPVVRSLSGRTPRSCAEAVVFHARPPFSASSRAATSPRDGSTERAAIRSVFVQQWSWMMQCETEIFHRKFCVRSSLLRFLCPPNPLTQLSPHGRWRIRCRTKHGAEESLRTGEPH